MTLYRIVNWSKFFENNRTRELKRLDWVPVPNKHDGDGFTEIMAEVDGVAIFGGWILILQLASKCDPRGTLLRHLAPSCGEVQVPHTPVSIARITRANPKIIERSLLVCSRVGRIEAISLNDNGLQNPATGCGKVPEATPPSPQDLALNGMEGNGMEGNLLGLQVRVSKWFRRKESTAWATNELKALKEVGKLKTEEPDVVLLEKYYTAPHESFGDSDYRRRDIVTLLNHWNSEIDRARAWSIGKFKPNGAGAPKPFTGY